MWNLRITPGATAPIYQQIVCQIRHAIALGLAAEGAALPSVRMLAEQLLINPNTVAKAYADLSKDGFIEAQPGRGMTVAPRRAGLGLTRPERLRRIDPLATQLVHDAVALDLSAADVQEIVDKKWKALEAGIGK